MLYFCLNLLLALLSTNVLAKVLPTEPSPDSKWAVGSNQTIKFDVDTENKAEIWNKFSIDLMTGPDLYTVSSGITLSTLL